VRHIDNLEMGHRRDGGGLDGEDSRDGDEAADVLEHAGGLGHGGDVHRRYKNTHLDVHGIFENKVRRYIVLEVTIYIPEHIRSDVNGADRGSGWRSELHPTAREAVVGVSFSALAMLTAVRCCDGLSWSTLWSSGSRKRSQGCGPRLLQRWWRYCGLMLRGKRMHGLLHWRGNGGWGGWRWRWWPRHGDNLSKPSLKRGGPANRLGEGVILKGRLLEDLPDEGQ
jgi:hypothetical protein